MGKQFDRQNPNWCLEDKDWWIKYCAMVYGRDRATLRADMDDIRAGISSGSVQWTLSDTYTGGDSYFGSGSFSGSGYTGSGSFYIGSGSAGSWTLSFWRILQMMQSSGSGSGSGMNFAFWTGSSYPGSGSGSYYLGSGAPFTEDIWPVSIGSGMWPVSWGSGFAIGFSGLGYGLGLI